MYCREFLHYFDRITSAMCDCQSSNVVNKRTLLLPQQIALTSGITDLFYFLFPLGSSEKASWDMGEGKRVPGRGPQADERHVRGTCEPQRLVP